jgi:hypothetical protein
VRLGARGWFRAGFCRWNMDLSQLLWQLSGSSVLESPGAPAVHKPNVIARSRIQNGVFDIYTNCVQS